jgi:hypothetical protein
LPRSTLVKVAARMVAGIIGQCILVGGVGVVRTGETTNIRKSLLIEYDMKRNKYMVRGGVKAARALMIIRGTEVNTWQGTRLQIHATKNSQGDEEREVGKFL